MLFTFIVPPFRNRFLAYGARSFKPIQPVDKKAQGKDDARSQSPNLLCRPLDFLATFTVPHDWFVSFYALSISLSLFWPPEALYLRGPMYRLVRDYTEEREATMGFRQVQLVWIMLLIQGGRRLYESITFETNSRSEMWVGHWAIGIFFYTATSVAVWVEGLRACLNRPAWLRSADYLTAAITSHQLSFRDLFPVAPSLSAFTAVPLFILASGFQYDCHSYLADLRNKPTEKPKTPHDHYKLPDHPAFHQLIAPHYTAECVIYLSLAIAAAPSGQIFSSGKFLNGTIGAALVFVVVNLGVTASGTREWYVSKFGEEKVKGRWRLIPGLW